MDVSSQRQIKPTVMLTALLFGAVCFLAYSNGANDNFKGVASLYGSRTCGYRTAISWATVTTFAGSAAAILLAQALLNKFSGKGLVPDELTASPRFLLAVALGAGATVILATLLGFPISTTHGLTGALVGTGLVASSKVYFGALGKGFVLPLLLSPALAAASGTLIYLVFRFARLRFGVTKEMCVCAGVEQEVLPLPQPDGVFAAQALPRMSVTLGEEAVCTQRYSGRLLGVNAGRLVDLFHFLSAGAVSFARGLNDTPKITALLLAAAALDIRWRLAAVAVAMAAGGLLNARKVAETMSHKITAMNPGQGFAANLTTALLVTTASLHGLPVSTTHVSVGSLLGIGITTRQVMWRPVIGVILSWVITLPCAAVLAAMAYWLVGPR
jgi:PiT family inorganic phosphate transporter